MYGYDMMAIIAIVCWHLLAVTQFTCRSWTLNIWAVTLHCWEEAWCHFRANELFGNKSMHRSAYTHTPHLIQHFRLYRRHFWYQYRYPNKLLLGARLCYTSLYDVCLTSSKTKAFKTVLSCRATPKRGGRWSLFKYRATYFFTVSSTR